ncbi:DUF2510 domain-containing protein [Smaragdicoccus niigatensis]|uniref:DUF2510 domain-containing protein n=1 Tax=Smaragdicoccus niigatensis TaxID=359359 RepID=UPI0003816D8C|nr:DUF2510 domain-containing protein [Smaragdicoccus niigatensis]
MTFAGGTTPPGWYPDQYGQQRWWDGYAWTDHVQAQTQFVPQPKRPRRLPLILGLVAAVVAMVGIGGGAAAYLLTRGPSPEDVVQQWLVAKTCEEEKKLVTGKELDRVQANLNSHDDEITCDYSDWDYSDYTVDSSNIDGSDAKFTVTGTWHYRGTDPDADKEGGFEIHMQLTKLDDGWKIKGMQWCHGNDDDPAECAE